MGSLLNGGKASLEIMSITLQRYQEADREHWNTLVANSINGTFLHTREFYDHNPANSVDDCSLMIFKKGKLIAVFPCNQYVIDDKQIWNSYLRATYGGIIVSNEFKAMDAVTTIGLIKQAAVEQGISEVIIRNPFRIYHRDLSDEIDYALWYHGFVIKSRELESAIRLTDYDTAYSAYDEGTRRSVKKSRASLVVEQSDKWDEYWSILEDNLQSKHGLKPTHSRVEIKKLIGHVGHDRIKLFLAFKEERIAAGILAFIANRQVIHAQYIGSVNALQEFRPLNGVIDHIVKWGCDNGFQYFNLGTSNFNAGLGFNEGLFRFKEGFGARHLVRETMVLKLI
jgi:hypothetical protein